MKAATRTEYGPPDVLNISELPIPIPKDNEVLVRVYSTTVSRTDCGVLWGKPYAIRLFTGLSKPALQITGTDFAGVVEAVGKDVKTFQPGQRVWGFNDEGLGSHTQYMTIPEDKAILTIPDNISFEEAAASAEGAHYAINFLNKTNLKAGDKVMVYGASGAIGSAAVQLCKYYGAYVTAVCNTKNVERIKGLGPDRVIDYEKEDFTQDTERYHHICDAVGKSRFRTCRHLLRPGGVYISSELGPNWENLYLSLIGLVKPGKKVKFPLPTNIKRSLQLMQGLLREGKFTPLIDRTYPYTQIADAFTYTRSGQKTGNVLIDWTAA